MKIHKILHPRIGVIADDLTGCGDVSYFFTRRGLKTRIFIDSSNIDRRDAMGCDVLVINTDTRLVRPSVSYRRVARAAALLKRSGVRYFFKKIDSTLRGNIGPELDAFMAALHIRKLSLIAAFPAMGRKTCNGFQYVNDKKIEDTFFGKDPRNRIVSSHIPTLLRLTAERGDRIRVFDAVSTRDLENIVRKNPSRYFAGSAGILEALASAWPVFPQRRAFKPAADRIHADVLIVCGSMHPINRRQLKEVQKKRKCLTLCKSGDKKRVRGTYIIRTPVRKGRAHLISQRIVRRTIELIRRKNIEKLMLIGGDTAQKVCRALKIKFLDVSYTLEHGIVGTRANTGLPVILKPGGFGTKKSIVYALQKSEKRRRQ